MTRSGKSVDESLFEASGGPRLIAELQESLRRVRLLQAEQLDLVAELERQGIAQLAGYPSTRALILDALRVAPLQATRMVERAAHVTETVTPTGHTSPASLPTVRAALREGLIDGEHIDAVAKTLKQIPDSAGPAVRELVESTLGETARTENPYTVFRHGAILLDRINSDGDQPSDKAKPSEPRNSFSYSRSRDGGMKFVGEIERDAAEELELLLGFHGKPQPLAPGMPDPRSKQERLGDAMTDIIHRAANPSGGAKVQLTVLLDLNVLTDAVGTATLESGCSLAPSAVRRLACDADFIPMVLKGQSVPLDAGRTRRLVKPKQREALVARDRGCAYPGCCMPARWTDAHHIKHWLDGGPTDLDNLVLTCRRHHQILHHSAWKVRITNGLPEFIPPKWIDPQQRPMRNKIHLRP